MTWSTWSRNTDTFICMTSKLGPASTWIELAVTPYSLLHLMKPVQELSASTERDRYKLIRSVLTAKNFSSCFRPELQCVGLTLMWCRSCRWVWRRKTSSSTWRTRCRTLISHYAWRRATTCLAPKTSSFASSTHSSGLETTQRPLRSQRALPRYILNILTALSRGSVDI